LIGEKRPKEQPKTGDYGEGMFDALQEIIENTCSMPYCPGLEIPTKAMENLQTFTLG
jgi:hypothetical protein